MPARKLIFLHHFVNKYFYAPVIGGIGSWHEVIVVSSFQVSGSFTVLGMVPVLAELGKFVLFVIKCEFSCQ